MNTFFEHKARDGQARCGVIHTAHGDIETPAFMPVGTQGTVKSLDVRDLHEAGAQIILGNTYHLHLRPGEGAIAVFGGLHKFMGWDGPILTDSGGFQVFSLGDVILSPRLRRGDRIQSIDELDSIGTAGRASRMTESHGRLVSVDGDGVTFRSHLDGSEHRFTPEIAIEMQQKIGADIIMAFDQCTRDDVSEDVARRAMERTHRWAERCVDFHRKCNPHTFSPCNAGGDARGGIQQYLFGIIQGGQFESLRRESAKFITSLPFDGIAIGGESIGYNRDATKKILGWIGEYLPEDKPRYTMGVGVGPEDIFAVVEQGADMFDCVAPTRMARHGALYTSPFLPPTLGEMKRGSRIDITNTQFKSDQKPIDEWCACSVCKGFVVDGKRTAPTSRAYLHHLFRAEELLAYRLASIHNVSFMLQLMAEIRAAIQTGRFQKLKTAWIL